MASPGAARAPPFLVHEPQRLLRRAARAGRRASDDAEAIPLTCAAIKNAGDEALFNQVGGVEKFIVEELIMLDALEHEIGDLCGSRARMPEVRPVSDEEKGGPKVPRGCSRRRRCAGSPSRR